MVVIVGLVGSAFFDALLDDRGSSTGVISGAAEPMTDEEIAATFGGAVYRLQAEGCGREQRSTAFAVDQRHLLTSMRAVQVDSEPTLTGADGTPIEGRVIGTIPAAAMAVIEVDQDLPVKLDWSGTSVLSVDQRLVNLTIPVSTDVLTMTSATIEGFEPVGDLRPTMFARGTVEQSGTGSPALTEAGRVAGIVLDVEGADGLMKLSTFEAQSADVLRIVSSPEEVPVDCDAAVPEVEVPAVGDVPEVEVPAVGDAPEVEVPTIVDPGAPAPTPEKPETSAPSQNGSRGTSPSEWRGSDPALDGLSYACEAGDMATCDLLFRESPLDTPHQQFADTCGERNEPGDWCVEIHGQPEINLTSDPEFERQTASCEEGEWGACDQLAQEAPESSTYAVFGETCGHRRPTGKECEVSPPE